MKLRTSHLGTIVPRSLADLGTGKSLSYISRPRMQHAFCLLVAIIAAWPLSGCMLLNDNVRIENDKVFTPDQNRTLVILGVGVEGAWSHPSFGVSLDEYSIDRKKITGNCWRFNRIQASVPVGSRTVQYFAFDAAPGYYIFSGFNAVALRGENMFFAPKGKIVYFGDFVYTNDGLVVNRRSITATIAAFDKTFPHLKERAILAETTTAMPTMFLCAP